MSTLTQNTAVPTFARGALRAFIKGQAGFDAWLARRGVASRDVKNADLIDYALAHGLEHEVLAILNAGTGPTSTPVTAYEAVADIIDAGGAVNLDPKAYNVAVDAEVKASIVGMTGNADMAAILAPVEAFLSPLVKGELEKALAPVIAAANKPAKTIEVEKIVYQASLAPLPTGAVPYATQENKVTLKALFGIKGEHANKLVSMWNSHGMAPTIDPFFVIDKENMAMLATGIERGSNIWNFGPSGSGKSTMPVQFAAYTNRPCITFSFEKQMDTGELIGGDQVLPDGSTAWKDGALIQAIKRPGTVIVLDEITAAPSGVHFVLHSLASESRSYTIPSTGEKVSCAPGVVFVATDNTNGTGDQTGQYHGTHPANAALVNRFKRMLEVNYLSKKDETEALISHTGCPYPAASAMADFASRARKMPEMENVPFSIRQMVGFIQACQDGFSPKSAANATFLTRLPQAERAALETLFTLAWANEFSALMSGSAVDAKSPDAMGPQSPAAKAFDDETSAQYVR